MLASQDFKNCEQLAGDQWKVPEEVNERIRCISDLPWVSSSWAGSPFSGWL